MKIKVESYNFEPNPENEITSSNILKANQRRVSNDFKYDDDGLFSERIFGRVGRCECGELKQPGFCKDCQTKVVDINNLPDYYIDLNIYMPKFGVDYKSFKKLQPILEYEAFVLLEEDGYSIHSIEEEADIDETKVKIGIEAAKIVNPSIDEWVKRNCTRYLTVPHPVQRPNILGEDGKIIVSQINRDLVTLLKKIEYINVYKTFFDDLESDSNYFLLSIYREIYKAYNDCCKSIFNAITEKRGRIVDNQMRAHRISSAIKGVVTNRFDVDEDIALIGDTFISTLYPYIYKKYNGDMEAINRHLVENNEIVLINRAPTIAHYSILAVKPRVASCYELGTFDDGAIGVNTRSNRVDDEIDSIGLRTIGVNPIITDGFGMDFDGDTVLIIPLFSNEAKEEALQMLPSKNYINYANGAIRNVIPEDILFATQEQGA